MFPNNYSFNPGVVLDPITMTPMVTNSGNITVNPLGVPMRPEQKIWQKMFIKNIPQECPNDIMIRLLTEFGIVKNFKRAVDNRGKLLSFCHFDLESGEQILRIKRIFPGNIRILDKTLEIKISNQTDNFLKQWLAIQRQQWRKKLQTPNMNQAKQYDTIQEYQMRDDKKIKYHLQQTLRQINIEVKKLAIQKMRQQQRKQHPKQKQRQKKKKKLLEDLQRNFHQKQEFWLRRQREKERQYRKQREKERQREKMKYKKLQREIDLDPDEEERRIIKFITIDRQTMLDKEEQEDIEVLIEANPPLPEDDPSPKTKKNRFILEAEVQVGQSKIEEIIMEVPKNNEQIQEQKKQIKRNQIFDSWQQTIQEEEVKPEIQLNLPQIQQEQIDKEQQSRKQAKLEEIKKQVPQNKQDLWQFPIDWEKLSKSVVLEKNIRPWLQKCSDQYIGGVQEKFIALVQKKLFSRSHPDKIIKILKKLLDDDAEQFVLKLWKTLVYEYLKLQNGLI